MKRLARFLTVLLVLGALPALAATIEEEEGATRTVTGTVAATEPATGGVVGEKVAMTYSRKGDRLQATSIKAKTGKE